jgi:hypothetical protein
LPAGAASGDGGAVEKLMYLVSLPTAMARAEVRQTMLGQVAPALMALGSRRLTMDLDDEQADVPAPVPPPESEDAVRAVVSLWVDTCDGRGPAEEVLAQVASDLAGYQVVESLCTDYGDNPWSSVRDWPDGTRSPGLLTVAAIEKPADRDDEEWYRYWHSTVSTVSAAIQPRCRYVRNAVFRPVTPGAPPYRALVEEAWPSAEHVTDPMLFYCADGDPERMATNVQTMIETITRFTDLSTLRSYTMSEWILQS